MEYLTTDKPYPRGELLIRGNTIFSHYHKNPEETAKSVDADGWFGTGDVVQVDELGRFKIIDRVKNLFKLAQGEYVSPERIENKYLANLSYLQSAYVHGDSDKTSLVALFGIEPEPFADFAGRILKKRIDFKTDFDVMSAACKDQRVIDASQKQLDRIAKEFKFIGYERVRAHYLYVNPFQVENNLMTPTMKVKRAQVKKHFRPELDQLYEKVAAEDALKPQRALL